MDFRKSAEAPAPVCINGDLVKKKKDADLCSRQSGSGLLNMSSSPRIAILGPLSKALNSLCSMDVVSWLTLCSDHNFLKCKYMQEYAEIELHCAVT